MKIVTKNSLTLSNVNDGTITHYAYANSADGKDGFYVGGGTNLLQGTQDFSGSNWLNFVSVWKKTDETYNGLSVVETTSDWSGIAQYYQVKQDETYTFSLFARYTSGTGKSNIFIELNNDPENGHKKAQIHNNYLDCFLDTNWKKCSITFTATSDGYVKPRMERSNNNTNVLRVCGFMFEEGTVAHPWSPAPSEAHPSYIGQYTDFNTTASTDPTKYRWSLIKGSDSYTHTAYSWSADGKDGFTTVYPNLNLLSNTTFKNYTPLTNQYLSMAIKDSGVNNKPYVSMSYNNPTENTYTDTISWGFNKEYFKPSTAYTFSFYLRGNGTIRTHVFPTLIDTSSDNGLADGKVIRPTSDGMYDWNLTSEWVRHTYTFVTKSSITDKQYFLFRIITGNSVDICLPKVEEGLTATPWMPSSSEVKTSDYPSYIGQYTDFIQADSTNPSNYTWAIFKGQNSNAYTAYSWSADGTDRFSTTYPNLNLLDGTSQPFIMGYGIPNTTWDTTNQVSGISLPLTVTDTKTEVLPQGTGFPYMYIPNVTYTQSIYISTDAPLTGTPISFTWFTSEYGHNMSGVDNLVKISTNVYRATSIYTWSSSKTSASGRNADIKNLTKVFDFTKGTFLKFYKPKLELGSIATPWTPSESEAQEQWQDAIPMYVGVGEKDSQNPTDYRWQLNPRYVQASSDSGLSNKAGLDDLASVVDTANDALVQAQNAVSNEDYTSWLEHDYQTTIDNLREISAQNQEDINNVDDRTTIVEGFYGEMKVKWNFIDESFSFSEEGMFISNAQSKMSIQITSDKIVFWDNNVDVAFITGEVLNIQKGVFLESATIGNHLITKFSDSSPVTIIRYVGGIT